MDNEDFNHSMQRFIKENLEIQYDKRLKNPTWEELKQQFESNQKITNPMRGSRNLKLIAGQAINSSSIFLPMEKMLK